jgi:hypothetical protein
MDMAVVMKLVAVQSGIFGDGSPKLLDPVQWLLGCVTREDIKLRRVRAAPHFC